MENIHHKSSLLVTSRSLPDQSETYYNKQSIKYFRKILRNSLQNVPLFLSLIKKVWTQKARFVYYKDLFKLLKVQSKRTKICITNSFLMHFLPTKHTALFLYQFENVVLPSFDVRAFALSYCVLFTCFSYLLKACSFFWREKEEEGSLQKGWWEWLWVKWKEEKLCSVCIVWEKNLF